MKLKTEGMEPWSLIIWPISIHDSDMSLHLCETKIDWRLFLESRNTSVSLFKSHKWRHSDVNCQLDVGRLMEIDEKKFRTSKKNDIVKIIYIDPTLHSTATRCQENLKLERRKQTVIEVRVLWQPFMGGEKSQRPPGPCMTGLNSRIASDARWQQHQFYHSIIIIIINTSLRSRRRLVDKSTR